MGQPQKRVNKKGAIIMRYFLRRQSPKKSNPPQKNDHSRELPSIESPKSKLFSLEDNAPCYFSYKESSRLIPFSGIHCRQKVSDIRLGDSHLEKSI